MEMNGSISSKGRIRGRMHKHLAPVTLTKIQRAAPFNGRVNFYEKNFVYILTSVVTGEEKSRKEFKKGEIAFVPSGCMLCFFLQDTRSYKPMNPLGEITDGLPILESCKRGDSIQIDNIVLLSG
ncbi:MAG: cyclophilin-like family protein [Nitrososphaerales archaeon]